MRRRAPMVIAVSGVAAAGLWGVSDTNSPPLLVWNASASAPVGLYRIEQYEAIEVDDYLLVQPDETLAKFIAERGYLPENIPLLKRVAALADDEICRDNAAIIINDIRVAKARDLDSVGREMPAWSGCMRLQPGEIFLLNDPENSLDGRYFGATKAADAIGVARPVWVRR